jgi:hypothetical protein
MRAYVLLLLVVLAAGCNRPAAAPVVAGPKSPPGWEVRYNAAIALFRRGSNEATQADVLDIVLEMFDEDQQRRNFRTKTDDGREYVDETGAATTVIGALQAVTELHRKQPKADLGALKAPIENLTKSTNPTVRVQARQAELALFSEKS